MPRIEFFGPSASDRSQRWAETQRLVNWYREPIGTRKVLRGVMGMIQHAPMAGIFCRAMLAAQGEVYVLQDGRLWGVAGGGAVGELGSVPNSPISSLSTNFGAVTAVAGGRYFVWKDSALTEPTLGAFDDAGDVTFFGQRTIISEMDGRRIQWSDMLDPTAFDAGTAWATKEQRDDNILRILPVGGQLWIFGEQSIEQWYLGEDGPVWMPGALIETGLKNRALLTPFPNGAFFIGNDHKAYLAAGGQTTPVSVKGVETALEHDEPVSCFAYSDNSHQFLCVAFRNRPAWCYDLVTGEWHERAEGREGAWRVRHAVQAFGGVICGTDAAGLVRLTRAPLDLGLPLIRRAVGTTVEGPQPFRVAEVRMRGSVGRVTVDPALPSGPAVLGLEGGPVMDHYLAVIPPDIGLLIEDGHPPRDTLNLQLRVSDNDAHTWSIPALISMGDGGDYGLDLVERSLGQFWRFTPEVTISQPYDVSLSAEMDVRIA